MRHLQGSPSTWNEELVESCISVYRKEDNPGPGCAQKYPLVWVTSGSHSALQLSRMSSRDAPGPFPAVPWCCRWSMLTMAAVSSATGGLSHEKHPLMTTPWDLLKSLSCYFPVSYRVKRYLVHDTGALNGTGVFPGDCSLTSSQIQDRWRALRLSSPCTPLLHAVLSPMWNASLGHVWNENQKPAQCFSCLYTQNGI